jgi:hypothetical protein
MSLSSLSGTLTYSADGYSFSGGGYSMFLSERQLPSEALNFGSMPMGSSCRVRIHGEFDTSRKRITRVTEVQYVGSH